MPPYAAAPVRARRGIAAAAQGLLQRRPPHPGRRLTRRELITEAAFALGLVGVAAALAALAPTPRALDAGPAVALVVSYAVVARAALQVGAGFVLPTQLVFVPMLFVLPLPVVPLAVAAGRMLSRAPDLALRRAHPERLVTAAADAWYSLGPVAVLALALEPTAQPAWGDWEIYLAALAAQLACDAGVSTAREWLGAGLPPLLQARVMTLVAGVDAVLAPVGLMAAFATVAAPYSFVLVVPFAAGLAVFARERSRRIGEALELLDELRAGRRRLHEAQQLLGATLTAGLDACELRRIVASSAAGLVGADFARLVPAGPAPALPVEASWGKAGDLEDVLAAAGAGVADGQGVAEARAPEGVALALRLPGDAADARAEVLLVARHGRTFSPEEREGLRALVQQAAISLSNVELHERLARQAVTDELTGLLNHRRLQEVLAREIQRSRRYERPLSLLMLDIDDFKRVNDTCGHQQGDRVLRAVADALRGECRQLDHPARYGGEELALALPEVDLDGAVVVAERLRARIAALAVPRPDGGSVRVTASVGVASAPACARGREALVAAADAALYSAKHAGKDRVAVAPRCDIAAAGSSGP